MPSAATLGVFALAALALLVVPGPAVLYIVTRSIEQGRAAGLVSALGVATGSLVHVAFAAAGVSAVLAASAPAFTAVKLGGAAYLGWLGVTRLLRPHPAGDGGGAGEAAGGNGGRTSLARVYGQGVVVNALNPKVALFFLAFLPQFVESGAGPVALQVTELGAVLIVLGICSDGTYALLAGTLGERLRASPYYALLRDRVSGGVLVGLGVVAAAARRRTL